MFKKLFQQTFVYGLATVLPRALAIVLVPLYTKVLPPSDFGIYATILSYIVLGNVLLSYGMETAFFRFVSSKKENPEQVQSTSLISILGTSLLFLTLGYFFREPLGNWLGFDVKYITYSLFILVLDALVVIPFVWYRAQGKSLSYAILRIINVCINLGINLFLFLLLPEWEAAQDSSFLNNLLSVDNKVEYIFIANVIASGATLLLVLPVYHKIGFHFSTNIWKKMLRYGFPVLIAGIAFSINETFDKILLKYLLPPDTASAEIGVYAACYKLGVFITLFATAFRLGVEPFFFKQAAEKNAPKTYAAITKYFIILGSAMLLFVVVYIDIFKQLLIKDEAYWVALPIVPLILLANLCLGIYHNLSVWYKVTDKTKVGAYISVLGAIITLVVNFALIPLYSYIGAAIATLLAYSTMMVLSYFWGRKQYPIPYAIKSMSGYLMGAVGFSIISFYIFDRNLYIGTLLLLVFLLGIFVFERNEIKALLKK